VRQSECTTQSRTRFRVPRWLVNVSIDSEKVRPESFPGMIKGAGALQGEVGERAGVAGLLIEGGLGFGDLAQRLIMVRGAKIMSCSVDFTPDGHCVR